MKKTYEILKDLPEIKKAAQILKQDEEHTFEQLKELVLIPAFSRHEEVRAKRYREMMEAEGFEVTEDEVHNVYTVIKGSGGGPVLYVTGHLDTVFPLDTPLEVVEKEPGKFYCPGIGDDTSALAQNLALMRAFRDSGIKLKGDLIIGGNVGEEGLGDLYGVRNFFGKEENLKLVDGFISVDGQGPSVTYGGTGSYRYKVSFSNQGGHSNGDFGMPNPIHAMGRAIAKIADVKTPNPPWTTFAVGVVDGGTSVNSIAHDCEFLLDIRSNGKAELDAANEEIMKCITDAVAEENARWKRDEEYYAHDSGNKKNPVPRADRVVELKIEKMGDRPVGNQSLDDPIVKAALTLYEVCGEKAVTNANGSTDANIPISLGIPGLAVGRSGKGAGSHSRAEWFSPEGMAEGEAELFLMICGLLGVDGVTEPLLPVREK
jgi:acetylornithine deacetylase/succinyl-diaminopimelate desuccinylase-like protein